MGIGFPKPRPVIEDRIADKREREKLERAFKLAVWLRDRARCRACDRKVIHSIERIAERGEVHHRRGRNVMPEDRFNVAAAVLLCYRCHCNPSVVARFRGAA